MSTTGYEEAMHTALDVLVEPGLSIRIPSIPAMVMLKILAWHERREARDAQDVLSLMQGYDVAENRERLYDFAAFGADFGYQLERGLPWLLGHDLAIITSQNTRNALLAIFTNPSTTEKLARQMSATIPLDNAQRPTQALLADFTNGFVG